MKKIDLNLGNVNVSKRNLNSPVKERVLQFATERINLPRGKVYKSSRSSSVAKNS
jgi:hypothetical protein